MLLRWRFMLGRRRRRGRGPEQSGGMERTRGAKATWECASPDCRRANVAKVQRDIASRCWPHASLRDTNGEATQHLIPASARQEQDAHCTHSPSRSICQATAVLRRSGAARKHDMAAWRNGNASDYDRVIRRLQVRPLRWSFCYSCKATRGFHWPFMSYFLCAHPRLQF